MATPEIPHLQRQLLDSIFQAVIATDLDGRILFWNRQAERLYGWTAEEALGRPIAEVTPSSLSREHADAIMAQLAHGESWSGEFLVRRKDGSLFVASVMDAPFFDADGKLAGIMGFSSPVNGESSRYQNQAVQSALEGFASSSSYAVEVHDDGKMTWTSTDPEAEKPFLGYTHSEYESLGGWPGFVLAEDWPKAQSHLDVILGGQPDKCEFRVFACDQSVRWLLNTVEPVWDDHQGRVVRFYGVALDITRQKTERLALERSETLFSHIFALSPAAIVITRLSDGQIINVNQAFTQLLGFDYAEVIGTTTVDLHIWPQVEDRERVIGLLHANRRVLMMEQAFRHKDGSLRETLFAGETLWVGAEELKLMLLIDNTERKAEQAALAASEALFSRLFSSNPIAIVISTLAGGIIQEANAAFLRLFGVQREDIVGSSSTVLDMWAQPEDRTRLVSAIQRDGTMPLTKIQVKRRDGRLADVFLAAEIVVANNEKLLLTFLLDVTELEAARRALTESEQRIQRLFALVPIPLIVTRLSDGVVLHANEYARAVFAVNGSIAGLQAARFYARSEERGPLLEQLRRLGTVENREVEIRRGDGTIGWSLTSMTLMTYGDEEAIVAVFHDITERRLNEQYLRRMTQRLALLRAIDQSILTGVAPEITAQMVLERLAELLPYAHGSVFTITPDGQSLDVISAFGTLTGTFVAGKRYPFENRAAYQALITEGRYVIEDSLKIANPSPLLRDRSSEGIRSILMMAMGVSGKVVGAINLGFVEPGVVTDEYRAMLHEVADQLAIAFETYRLASEAQHYTEGLEIRVAERTQALNQAKERVEVILNSTADAILALDAEGRVEQVNPGFNTLFGYADEAIIGRSVFNLFPENDAETVRAPLVQVLDRGDVEHIEVSAHHHSGHLLTVAVTLSPITQRLVGSNVRAICTIRDVSWLKRAEVELRQLLARERELNDLKSRFVSMISHEFRTPLSSIQSSTDLLRRYRDRITLERQDQYLEHIQSEIRQLVTLLDDVLTINKADAIDVIFQPATVDLVEVCRTVVEEVRYALAGNQSILFTSSVERLIAPVDLKLLRQALGNLLSNAVKYSPDGMPVQCSLAVQAESAVITVRDEGIGIPEEDQAHLFETFHRAANVGAIQGTGLGLAIVKRAMDAHGGTIRLISAEGKGTTVILNLPLRPPS